VESDNGTSTLSAVRRDAIITQELDLAYSGLQARLARAAATLVLASGPPGGAYAEVAQVLRERALAAGVRLDIVSGEGSVGNVRALADGSALFALVQNDVAAAAYAGSGRFGGTALPELRALGSLFPEAVQLVVRAGGPIKQLADLKGRRVDLGLDRSGSRTNALAILAANGVALDSLAAVTGHNLPEAAALLASGQIDALFATVHAPARALQALAARTPLAWIDLLPTDALRASGLVPLKMPARTYAGQSEPVQTLAATALMITRADVPAAQVESMLKLLFDGAATQRFEGSAMAQIGRDTARQGVMIPWAAAAAQFLDRTAAVPAK